MAVTIVSESDNSSVRYKVICKGWETTCKDLMELHNTCEECDSVFPMEEIIIKPFLVETQDN